MAATTHAIVPMVNQPVTVSTEIIWRLSVEQYHAMIQAGILTEDDPSNCWKDGWLPKCRKILNIVSRRDWYVRPWKKLPPGWYVDSQEPLTTADSEPEPYVMIVRGETRHEGEENQE